MSASALLIRAAQTGRSAQILPLFHRWRESDESESRSELTLMLQHAFRFAALNDHVDTARQLVALPGIEADVVLSAICESLSVFFAAGLPRNYLDSAIVCAAKFGSTAILRIFLSLGFASRQTVRYSLISAVKAQLCNDFEGVIETLTAAGAFPSLVLLPAVESCTPDALASVLAAKAYCPATCSTSGATLLAWAMHLNAKPNACITLLLRAKVEVNDCAAGESSALHHAVIASSDARLGCVNTLLAAKADCSRECRINCAELTPLKSALLRPLHKRVVLRLIDAKASTAGALHFLLVSNDSRRPNVVNHVSESGRPKVVANAAHVAHVTHVSHIAAAAHVAVAAHVADAAAAAEVTSIAYVGDEADVADVAGIASTLIEAKAAVDNTHLRLAAMCHNEHVLRVVYRASSRDHDAATTVTTCLRDPCAMRRFVDSELGGDATNYPNARMGIGLRATLQPSHAAMPMPHDSPNDKRARRDK